VLALALLVLVLSGAAANAQTRPPTSVIPVAPQTVLRTQDPPLNTIDTLSHGVVLSEPRCHALPTALWLNVEGAEFCVRYWMSTAGGTKDEALVYIHADIGGRDGGRVFLADDTGLNTSGRQQRNAEHWSRLYGGPFISIGRVGAYGSSGDHLRQRRMLLEVRVMMAALDALKQRHGLKRFHLVGQSGGGHTVAALLQMRSDLGCAVMSSGILSVRTNAFDLGWPITAKIAESYDPINFIDAIASRPGQRMIVLSDADDSQVPYHSQQEFVERVRANRLPILHIAAAAGDAQSHELGSEGLRLATDCANGADDAALIARYQTKAPPNVAASKEQAHGRP